MKMIHYSSEQIESLDSRPYNQNDLSWQAKPAGLWVSIEDLPHEKNNKTWKEWCEQESFCIENLKYSYEITLKESSNIVFLKTPEEIFEFTKKFPFIRKQWDTEEGRKHCETYELDWDSVKKKYKGIIIAPYQWHCRNSQDSCWYYGWDVASACLWDLTCIKEFKRIINNEH